MKLFKKITSFLELISKYFLTASLGIMTVITLIEVFRRYFLGLSFPWAEELVRYLLIWVTFVGGSIAFKKGTLVFMDLFINYLSKRKKQILHIIMNLIVISFLVIILVLSIDYTFSPSIMLQKSTGLKLPMFIPYLAIPTGFMLMIIFSVENLVSFIQEIRRG